MIKFVFDVTSVDSGIKRKNCPVDSLGTESKIAESCEVHVIDGSINGDS